MGEVLNTPLSVGLALLGIRPGRAQAELVDPGAGVALHQVREVVVHPGPEVLVLYWYWCTGTVLVYCGSTGVALHQVREVVVHTGPGVLVLYWYWCTGAVLV